MMDNLTILNFSQILLFDSLSNNQFKNPLKEFIYFIKSSGTKEMINFSFAALNESVHQHLSIKENYILDSVPTSLIKDKDNSFTHLMKVLKNPHLKILVEATHSLERKVENLNSSDKKLVSIVKALLSNSDYIFFESPENEQTKEVIKIIKDAMIFEATMFQRNIFVSSKFREVWLDISTHIVSRDDHYRFTKTKNVLNKLTPQGVKPIKKIAA